MCGASSGKFKFTDYNCISFDLDNTLASYKIGNQVEMENKIITDYLVKIKGYPSTLLSQPLDPNFILKGLILDSDNGNVIRITDDGTVFQACHGTKKLTEQQIEEYYPGKHWDVADQFIADPLKDWNGPYASKFIALQDYYDIGVSLIFARAVDAIDSIDNQYIKYHVWDDILESLHHMFDQDHFDANSSYYANMKRNPEKYYKKCSKRLLNWLKELRKQSKLLLITGSTFDFASHTASYTIGAEWKEYFDIVVCQASKPGFFTKTLDFYDASGNAVSEVQFGSGVYTKGNWRDLQKLVKNPTEAIKPKCLYVGDHLIQDVYTPDLYTSCDVVCVCEELEAEGVKGYGKCHPDERYLVSSMWGSYFYPSNNSTIWNSVIEKHSKLCVPSMEYVSQFPVDYEYSVNSNM